MKLGLRGHQSALYSAVVHGVLLAAILLLGKYALRPVIVLKNAGVKEASLVSLTYDPGALSAQQEHRAVHKKPAVVSKPSISQLPAPTPTPAASSAVAKADSQSASAGDGDIQIALLQNYPTPQPDLSTLAPGTKGDVVVDIVIDKDGKIASLTVVRGLGKGVDDSVVATLKQWTFSPALKDGSPVPSSQELLFHYERA